MNEFSSDVRHEQILKERKPLLAFDEIGDYKMTHCSDCSNFISKIPKKSKGAELNCSL